MIDGKNLFDQTVKKNKVTYEKIRKIAIGQRNEYTTGCLLGYIHFKNYYKMIAVDLSKQQALDADPKAFQQISFIENLDRAGNTRIYFILKETKERQTKRNLERNLDLNLVLEFSQGTVNVLCIKFRSVQLR